MAVWAVAAASLALAGGVRWDENFAWALVITGEAWYPPGHPQVVFLRGAPTLLTYGMAALMEAGAGPLTLNFHRNVLCLLATVLPVFALTFALCRRAWAAHCAVVLALAGVHLEFVGSYPQFVWPTWFSNGHVGLGYALFCLAALALRRLRLAYGLIGLLFIVHPAQMPALAVTALAQAAWLLWRGTPWRRFRGPLLWGATALAVSAGFIVSVAVFWTVDPPPPARTRPRPTPPRRRCCTWQATCTEPGRNPACFWPRCW